MLQFPLLGPKAHKSSHLHVCYTHRLRVPGIWEIYCKNTAEYKFLEVCDWRKYDSNMIYIYIMYAWMRYILMSIRILGDDGQWACIRRPDRPHTDEDGW